MTLTQALTVVALLVSPIPVSTVCAQNKELAPPTGLWAAQTDPTTIALAWRGVPGAAEYLLFGPKSSKGEAGAAIQQLARLGRSATRYAAPVIRPGLLHQFSIRAIDAKGLASSQVKFNPVVPQAKQATPISVPPPLSVTAKDIGSGRIRVNWSAVPGATGYFLGRSVAPGGFNALCALCPTETSYVDSGVVVGAKHIYTVAAITPFGTSQRTRSNEVSPTGGKVAGNTGDSDGPPKGVTDPKATLKSPTAAEVTWGGGLGAAGFQVYRRIGTGKEELVATLGGTVTSFLDHLAGGIGGGVLYGIQAVNAKGSSAKATVAIEPEKAPTDPVGSTPSPKGPSGLKASVMSPTTVRLTWLPGLVGGTYQVMRQASGTTQAIATLPGGVTNFLDHFPPGSMPGLIGYWIETVDGKATSEKITVTADPAKAAAGGEGEIDSLPRLPGRP